MVSAHALKTYNDGNPGSFSLAPVTRDTICPKVTLSFSEAFSILKRTQLLKFVPVSFFLPFHFSFELRWERSICACILSIPIGISITKTLLLFFIAWAIDKSAIFSEGYADNQTAE